MSQPGQPAAVPAEPVLTSSLLWIMAVAAGLAVANLYYNQPLLAEMGRSFQASAEKIGWVAMLTQAGYASGMLLLMPLGDAVEQRCLVLVMCLSTAVALVAIAVAPNFAVLALASFAVGAASIVPQLLVPFAATLSSNERRGRAVGTVMSGLLIGILLARTLAGYVGQHLGWRAMYGIAAAIMVALALTLRARLPRRQAQFPLSYGRLMVSLGRLMAEEPLLRDAAFTGAMLFGGFSAFWSTLVFLLETPPYHYGSQGAGLFGLVGVVGASAASFAGRWSDRRDARKLLRFFLALAIISFLVLWLFGHQLWGLIAGVILLDAGVMGGHVSNQSRIYRLHPEVHNRVNTVYMVTYFVGGAVGTVLATHAWDRFGWSGVCAVGGALLLAGLIKLLIPVRDSGRRQP